MTSLRACREGGVSGVPAGEVRAMRRRLRRRIRAVRVAPWEAPKPGSQLGASWVRAGEEERMEERDEEEPDM